MYLKKFKLNLIYNYGVQEYHTILNLKIKKYRYIKTEMDKYKNNTINRLEFIKMSAINFYPNNTLISTNKKRNRQINICLLIPIYFIFLI